MRGILDDAEDVAITENHVTPVLLGGKCPHHPQGTTDSSDERNADEMRSSDDLRDVRQYVNCV